MATPCDAAGAVTEIGTGELQRVAYKTPRSLCGQANTLIIVTFVIV